LRALSRSTASITLAWCGKAAALTLTPSSARIEADDGSWAANARSHRREPDDISHHRGVHILDALRQVTSEKISKSEFRTCPAVYEIFFGNQTAKLELGNSKYECFVKLARIIMGADSGIFF
jgi:hypothetical protein